MISNTKKKKQFYECRFSKMKTVTNLYILNLAFADEFYLIGVPTLIYTMHLGEWIFGVQLCKLYMISTSITQFTSSIFLVIMSADRYENVVLFCNNLLCLRCDLKGDGHVIYQICSI